MSEIDVRSIDHVVMPVRDLAATLRFYVDVLGMRLERFGDDRIALHFGDQKINVHVPDKPQKLVAAQPTPGSLDLCFLVATPLDEVVRVLEAHGVAIVERPSIRTGARGALRSVYVRDPDGNLVELSNFPARN